MSCGVSMPISTTGSSDTWKQSSKVPKSRLPSAAPLGEPRRSPAAARARARPRGPGRAGWRWRRRRSRACRPAPPPVPSAACPSVHGGLRRPSISLGPGLVGDHDQLHVAPQPQDQAQDAVLHHVGGEPVTQAHRLGVEPDQVAVRGSRAVDGAGDHLGALGGAAHDRLDQPLELHGTARRPAVLREPACCGARCRRPCRPRSRCLKPPGSTRHHGHAVAGHLDAQRVGQRLERVLGPRVPPGQRRAHQAGDGRHVHDATAARRPASPGRASRARRIGANTMVSNRCAGLVVGDVLDGAGQGVAGVVDQPVELRSARARSHRRRRSRRAARCRPRPGARPPRPGPASPSALARTVPTVGSRAGPAR